MNLTRYERETIINFNEAEDTASVYTHNPTLKRKLKQLSAERPAECRLERTSRAGQATDYIIPKAWVRIYPPRQLSTEQRVAMAERLHKRTLSQKAACVQGDTDPNSSAEGSYISQPMDSEKEA